MGDERPATSSIPDATSTLWVGDHLPMVAWTADLEGRLLRITNVHRVLGYTREEFLGEDGGRWLGFLHPADRPAVRIGWRGLFERDTPYDVEYRMRSRDGSWIWVGARASGTYTLDGVRVADGLSTEITGRKVAADLHVALADFGVSALRATEVDAVLREGCRVMRRVLEPDGVGVLRRDPARGVFVGTEGVGAWPDRDLVIQDAPGTIAQCLRESRDPFVFSDVEDERRIDTAELKRWKIRSGVVMPIAFEEEAWGLIAVFASTTRPWSSRDVAVVRAMGNAITAAVARFETEARLRAARELYESVARTAHEGIVTSAPTGELTFVNRRMAELLGDAPSSFLGRDLIDLVAEEDRELASEWRRTRERGENARFEIRFRRADGRVFWTSVSTSSLPVEGQQGAGSICVVSDITERVAAATVLASQKRQLDEAQHIAHVGSWELDIETRGVFCSDETYRLLGLPPQIHPLTGEFIRRLLADAPEPNRQLDAVIAGRSDLDLVHTVRVADGSFRSLHARASHDRHPVTGRRRVVGTIQDVTRLRRAEQEALSREARLQMIVSHLPVVMWSTDGNLRVDSIVGRAFGVTGSAGESVEDLVGGTPEAVAAVNAALRGRSAMFEVFHRDRDIRVYVEPLRGEGDRVEGTIGISFDVTEEKEIERGREELRRKVIAAAHEWQATFDSIGAPILLLDGDERVVRLNTAAVQVWRGGGHREAVGEHLLDVIPGSLGGEILKASRACREAGTTLSNRVRTDDGRHWDISASPWPGETARTTIFATDVTGIVQMQQSLQRSERMSAVGTLVSGVAHEVRNPLFGISATLDAMQAIQAETVAPPFVSALREQVSRLNDLMRDLLEYGKPVPPQFRPGDLTLLLKDACVSVTPVAAAAGVEVSLTPADLPQLQMDGRRLVQVFENLLRNAIQHSNRGGTVELRAFREDDTLVVTVADRGSGFREEDLPHLFEPFFTRRRGGTGLGLSLAQRTVEEHGGRIAAACREGGGALITVVLPIGREGGAA